MGIHDEAKLDVKFIAFAKQMNLYLNHFPSHEKFGLSQAIRCKAYEIYGFVVESQKRYQKKTSLTHRIRYFNPWPCQKHSQPAPPVNHPESKTP